MKRKEEVWDELSAGMNKIVSTITDEDEQDRAVHKFIAEFHERHHAWEVTIGDDLKDGTKVIEIRPRYRQ